MKYRGKFLQSFGCIIPLISAVILYAPILSIWFFWDDIPLLIRAVNLNTRWHIFMPDGYKFRPIQALINSINCQLFFDQVPFFTHLCSLICFLGSVVLVYKIAEIIYPYSRKYPLIASMFFTLFPGNVYGLSKFYLGQNLVTFFCLLLFWLSIRYFGKSVKVVFFGSLLISLFALFSKEDGFVLVFAIPLLSCLLLNSKRENNRFIKKDLPVFYTGILLSAALYLGMRLYSGTTFIGYGNHKLIFSLWNVFKHLIVNIFGLVYVGSTLDFFPNPKPTHILLSSIFSVLLAITCLSIIYKAKVSVISVRRSYFLRVSLILAGLILAAMFPSSIIPNFTELYLLTIAPYYSLLIGLFLAIFLDGAFNCLNIRLKLPGIALILLLSLRMGLVTENKVQHVVRLSGRALTWYRQLVDNLPDAGGRKINICFEVSSPEEREGLNIERKRIFLKKIFPGSHRDRYSIYLRPDIYNFLDAVWVAKKVRKIEITVNDLSRFWPGEYTTYSYYSQVIRGNYVDSKVQCANTFKFN